MYVRSRMNKKCPWELLNNKCNRHCTVVRLTFISLRNCTETNHGDRFTTSSTYLKCNFSWEGFVSYLFPTPFPLHPHPLLISYLQCLTPSNRSSSLVTVLPLCFSVSASPHTANILKLHWIPSQHWWFDGCVRGKTSKMRNERVKCKYVTSDDEIYIGECILRLSQLICVSIME